ncbi:UDP-2,3-diacylglucosamine diphosphatase LpxI [Candidatus Babeliales bacterium]|nr:UDP-2,3-diacylglucosamine diphosphatase LpxI [Candidatus Babeliales bacterium]
MIALIAGTGTLPSQACKSFLDSKQDFFVLSLFPEDNLEQLKEALPSHIKIIHEPFYKAHKILKLLEKQNTKQALFIGKVDKQNLLKKFKLDWFSLKLLTSLVTKSDMNVMNKVKLELEKRNIQLLSQKDVLGSLLVNPGILTGSISPDLQKSIDMGMHAAEQISRLDIGQTVIIKDKMILAIEAIEGTDECIKRGISLGREDIIVCKTAHAKQSKKFDSPTIGPETLRQVKRHEIKAIAWQASQTFIADKEEFVARAKELGITLVAV